MPDEPIHVPPFPPLKWDTYSWAGEITLPSWAGFQSRRGAYGSASLKMPSHGTATLRIESLDRETHRPPSPEQAVAMRHLVENEAAVAQAVAQVIFERYPVERAKFLKGYGLTTSDEVPEITQVSELRPLMGLNSVHVLRVTHEGVAYIGFEFGCTWEDEHGAGVMTHRGRIVAVGHAAESFDYWVAREDSERGTSG